MNIPSPNTFAGRVTLRIMFFFGTSLMVLVGFNLSYTRNFLEEHSLQTLRDEVLFLTSDFDSKIDELRKDVKFLSSVPPIQGIPRSIKNHGIDPLDKSSTEQWQSRLATIFREMLGAKPQYLQIRYIGLANDGKELVRMDRDGGQIRRKEGGRLQKKGNEAYFKTTASMPPNSIYLSPFSLNREWGKIVIPRQLVIRASIPIYDDQNKLFGIVIINKLAEDILSRLMKVKTHGKGAHILNRHGEPMLTSSPPTNGDLSQNELIKNTEVKKFFATSTNQKRIVNLPIADQFVVATKVFYNPINEGQFLGVILTTPKEMLEKQVWKHLENQGYILLSDSSKS